MRKELGRSTCEPHARRLAIARRRVLLALALTVLAPRPRAAAEPDLADLEPFVDGIVASHLARDHVAGAQVAIVRDGAQLITLAAGLQARRPKRERPPGQLSVYSNYGAALAGG